MTLSFESHESIDSTQDRAHTLARAGAAHGVVVVAEVQTRGRGTRGRRWTSEPGGLWLSVVTRPEAADALERLSLRIGLRVADALEQASGLVPGRIQLKWPNDLVVDHGKLGGILCEASWQGQKPAWVVVGIGVNVTNPLPRGQSPPSRRLADLGTDCSADRLVVPVAQAVLAATNGTGLLTASELGWLTRRDCLAGRRVFQPVAGTIRGIAATGLLRIETGEGREVEVANGVAWTDLAPDEPGR